MSKWIACGSFQNPKKARSYARFSSKDSHATKEQAEQEAQKWRNENRYAFIWIEETK